MALGQRVRFAVFDRDGFTCRYCGKSPPEVTLHVDHQIPRCEGGSDDEANLLTSCRPCNLGKGAKPLSATVSGSLRGIRDCQERATRARDLQLEIGEGGFSHHRTHEYDRAVLTEDLAGLGAGWYALRFLRDTGVLDEKVAREAMCSLRLAAGTLKRGSNLPDDPAE